MKRSQWKERADAHCKAAKTLLDAKQFSPAYYLAGLAIEFALKARIARRFKAATWPEKSFVASIYDHDLAKLIQYAELEKQRLAEEARSPTFRTYWNTVKTWRIDSRYKDWSGAEARDMVEAVAKRGTGVLAWIRKHW